MDNNKAVEAVNEANMSAETEKVKISFGSHSGEAPVEGELNKQTEPDVPKDVVDDWPEPNLPKDAVDDWPAPSQIHSFYIVKYRALEDQNLRAKLDVAENDLQKKNQARFQIFEKLKIKRAERAQIRTEIHSLSVENKQFRTAMDEKRKEMEPLQQALGKMRGPSGEKGSVQLCSSEAELNRLIKSYEYRIQHESIPLSEEKQILREIKQLEATRDKVIANAAEVARLQDSLGEKSSIQDQVKSIGVDLDGARKEKQVIFAKIKQLDEAKVAIEKDIDALEEELTAITEKRDKIFDNINGMRKQREEGNAPFYQNRTVLTQAKVLAAKKDVEAAKELAASEVEKFMSLWNSNKAVRDDYVSRILQSLDMRQLSKDGRMRNIDEKPLLQVEKSVPSATAVVKPIPKQTPKEDSIPTAEGGVSSDQKVAKPKSVKNEGNRKTENNLEKVDEEEAFFIEKLPKVPKKDEVDEKKLKELKRQEEIAKRNQAEERKKKMAEKAAAKAAIKAQKEAEKKLKEREKKARKKSGAAAESEEPTESVTEVAELENVEEKIETLAPQKNKDRKEQTVKQRVRSRGLDSLPKAILKRKKATNYWLWAGSSAFAIFVLVVVGYSYIS